MSARQQFREVRGRIGFFGWIWRLLLLVWQVLMVAWFLGYTADVAPVIEGAQNEFEEAGAAIGYGLSVGMILFFWVSGTVILGLFVLLTRPARTMVPVDADS